ncbi:hypothetical protein H5410_011067 [Solanum commersonii]|uniref:Uncharacterized protein n=1 Tax=Solanum commersonii TaxID=4109 RepID=A0A9J6ANB0_SOLCO|nr:hypothetical protein H5410_011067 [Solanum commersonii]
MPLVFFYETKVAFRHIHQTSLSPTISLGESDPIGHCSLISFTQIASISNGTDFDYISKVSEKGVCV